MRPVEIRQGAALNIDVEMNTDLTSATEIQFVIDSSPRILKTLTGGTITNVTATQFTVAISGTDTQNLPPLTYKCQASATLGGSTYAIDFTPDKVRIKDSAFLDDVLGNRSGAYQDDY